MACEDWLPIDMDPADKAEFVEAYPDDCHAAAAAAWEDWAATLQDEQAGLMGVTSVTTGAQSVAFGGGYGSGKAGAAMRRAAWHRARSRVASVQAGPEHTVRFSRRSGLHMYGPLSNPEDTGVISTVDVGTIPPNPAR